MEVIKEMAEAGDGISFPARRKVRKELNEGKLSTIPVGGRNLFMPIYVAFLANRPLSFAAKVFMDFIQSYNQAYEQPPPIEMFLSRIKKS
jgi:DNA-binding transcriptional LysR family regulator